MSLPEPPGIIGKGCRIIRCCVCTTAAAALIAAGPPVRPLQLPAYEQNPLAVDRKADPVLAIARASADPSEFRALMNQAIDRSAQVAEAHAGVLQANAGRNEAITGRYPTVDLNLNGQQVITSHFSDDIDVSYERSRAQTRADATLSAEQTLFDFGATEDRITAAGARLQGAKFATDAEADDVALRAIGAWYDVFTYRALVRLAEAFTASQIELRESIRERIRLGYSALGDLPRVESYIASAQTDLARYRRLQASAEARFREVFGTPAPDGLARAPDADGATVSKEGAMILARSAPAVEGSKAAARAAKQDARAQRATTYPRVALGLDAGRYTLFDENNYDVRGRLTLHQRLFGGVDSHADQADARAVAAEAHAARVQSEAERDAAIAWSDVEALEQQRAALEESYVASRESRDVLAERFRVSRGTLFDLLEAESSYFNVAATYIRGITELDAARYIFLSRTGQLLPKLGIDPVAREGQ